MPAQATCHPGSQSAIVAQNSVPGLKADSGSLNFSLNDSREDNESPIESGPNGAGDSDNDDGVTGSDLELASAEITWVEGQTALDIRI